MQSLIKKQYSENKGKRQKLYEEIKRTTTTVFDLFNTFSGSNIPDSDNSLQEWSKIYYSLHDLVTILEYSVEIDEVKVLVFQLVKDGKTDAMRSLFQSNNNTMPNVEKLTNTMLTFFKSLSHSEYQQNLDNIKEFLNLALDFEESPNLLTEKIFFLSFRFLEETELLNELPVE